MTTNRVLVEGIILNVCDVFEISGGLHDNS